MMISVIIPNLHSKIIDKTIQSIVEQDLPDTEYEIIVVGQDKFGIVKNYPIVKFLETPRPTPPAIARNIGAKAAKGEILTFIDADCLADKRWLSKIIVFIHESERSVVGGGVAFREDNYWTLSDNISMFHEVLVLSPRGERSILPSLNLSVRRDIYFDIGGFDERYPVPSGEDADLCIRLQEKGIRLNFEPEAFVTHLPPRTNLYSLCRHGFYQGKFSTKFQGRRGQPVIPHLFFVVAIVLFLLSPFIALAAALRIYFRNHRLVKYWYCFPAIFLSKLFWCIGGTQYPQSMIPVIRH